MSASGLTSLGPTWSTSLLARTMHPAQVPIIGFPELAIFLIGSIRPNLSTCLAIVVLSPPGIRRAEICSISLGRRISITSASSPIFSIAKSNEETCSLTSPCNASTPIFIVPDNRAADKKLVGHNSTQKTLNHKHYPEPERE